MKNKRLILIPIAVSATVGAAVAIAISAHKSSSGNAVIHSVAKDASANQNFSAMQSQTDYNKMIQLINSTTFDVGNPLYELALKLNENAADTPMKIKNKILSENVNVLQPKLLDQLYEFDAQNPNGWTLDLSGAAWNNINLNQLDIFANFQNINAVSFSVVDNGMSQLSYFDIDSLKNINWLSKLSHLEAFQVSFDKNKLPSAANINISDIHSFENTKSLMQVNLNITNSAHQSIIVGDLNSSSLWTTKNGNFELILPSNYAYDNSVVSAYADITSSNDVNGSVTKFTKKLGSALPDPSDTDYKPIYIDNKEVDAFRYQNKWYWLLDNVNSLNAVKYQKNDGTRYYATTNLSGYNEISPRSSTYDQQYNKKFFEDHSPKFPVTQKLSNTNTGLVKTKFSVDDIEYGFYISDSQIVPDYDYSKIKFCEVRNGKEYYYTDFASISTNGLDEIESVYPLTYTNIPKKSVAISDPVDMNDTIKIDKEIIKPFLLDGKWEWNLENVVTTPVYYSSSTKIVFSDIDNVKSLQTIPNDINLIDEADFKSRTTRVLKEKFENHIKLTDSNVNEMNVAINVNGEHIKKLLRNGYIYFDDYNDKNITSPQITFVHKAIKPEDNEYFTTFDLLSKKYPNLDDCYQLVTVLALTIPSPFPFAKPTFNQFSTNSGVINIEPLGAVTAVLRNGSLYWDTSAITAKNPGFKLEQIKYYDSETGNFYETLPQKNIPKLLTEVTTTTDEVVPNGIQANIFDPNFNIFSPNSYKYFQYGNSINYDGISKSFVIFNSSIVWKDPLTAPKYIFNYQDPTSENAMYISSYDKVGALTYNKTTELLKSNYSFKTYDQLTPTDIDALTLKDPVTVNDKIHYTYYSNTLNQTMDMDIKAVEVEGKLHWQNPTVLSGAKYKITKDDNSIIYTDSLSSDVLMDAKRVDSVEDIKITSFVPTNTIIEEYKPIENKIMIAIISTLAGVFAVLIPGTFFGIKFFRGKRGK